MGLRDYQIQAIEGIQKAYGDGAKAVLLQLATGGGKTHIAANGIIAPSVAAGRRFIFAAHLEEILEDTVRRLTSEGLEVSMVKSGRKANLAAPVQVCSTPTLGKMLSSGREMPSVDRVILDECHRSENETNRAIIAHYKSRGALLLGLSGTPSRGDGKPLSEFDKLVCGPPMKHLISIGALVRPRVFAPSKILEKGVAIDPAELVLSKLTGRRVAVFAPDAMNARRIHQDLIVGGYSVELVLQDTHPDERRGVRKRLETGESRGIVSCKALIEGFDAPCLDCVVLCGAFTTITPWMQAIGRAMRIYPGKTEALVYDLRGAVYLHGLPDDDRVWTLEGVQGRSTETREQGLRTCRDCHAVFEPASTCPRCGSRQVSDPRPMRVQRAELFEKSSISKVDRARVYFDAMVAKFSRSGLTPKVAQTLAARKSPAWVKEALML